MVNAGCRVGWVEPWRGTAAVATSPRECAWCPWAALSFSATVCKCFGFVIRFYSKKRPENIKALSFTWPSLSAVPVSEKSSACLFCFVAFCFCDRVCNITLDGPRSHSCLCFCRCRESRPTLSTLSWVYIPKITSRLVQQVKWDHLRWSQRSAWGIGQSPLPLVPKGCLG